MAAKKAYKKRSGKSTLRKRVAKIESVVNSAEKKYNDTTGGPVSVGSSGSVISIGAVSQGDGVSGREGLKIKYTGMNCHFKFYPDGAVARDSTRIMIVRDNRDRSTPPIITDILQTNTVMAPLNQANLGRFTVLYDRHVPLSIEKPVTVTINRKLNSISRYEGTTANDVIKGGLYLLYVGTEPVLTSAIHYYIRCWYTDM